MKSGKFFLGLASLLVAFTFMFAACSKTGVDAGSTVSVFLTDGPGEYDAVNIDIQKVEVKVDNDSSHKHNDNFGIGDDDRDDHLQRRDGFGEWIDINFTPGIIDVLSLRNGVETQLGAANIATGTVRKIRITLGTKNSLVKDGVTYDLLLDSQTSNFLYVKLFDLHRQRGNNDVKVWVDFDIARSIVELNGKFYLKPVLRPFCNANFGEVAGAVLPAAAKAVVRITDGASFNAVALPNKDGKFKLRGLSEGTYTVTFEGIAPYKSQSVSNVVVTKGKTTTLASVTLVQ